MGILSKSFKSDSFQLHNSLRLNFANIRGLRWNFVECKSFLESNSPDIFALCETNLDDLIDFGNFSVRDYLFIIRKDSSSHVHGLAVYVKEGFPFARECFQWVASAWNWCIYPSSQVSGQASLISIVFNWLCSCQRWYKSLFLFLPA